jgi:hypothetical protein
LCVCHFEAGASPFSEFWPGGPVPSSIGVAGAAKGTYLVGVIKCECPGHHVQRRKADSSAHVLPHEYLETVLQPSWTTMERAILQNSFLRIDKIPTGVKQVPLVQRSVQGLTTVRDSASQQKRGLSSDRLHITALILGA